LRPYFWDVKFEELEVERNSFLIIKRVLDRGNLHDIRWLVKTYGKDEIKKVERLVNEKIHEALIVERKEMPLNKALKEGAQAEFGHKYPEKVSVYTIANKSDNPKWFSKEICTGPHVKNTKEIGKFKILKEESSAAGIRRIKAIVE